MLLRKNSLSLWFLMIWCSEVSLGDVWSEFGLPTPLPGLVSSLLHPETKEANKFKPFNKHTNQFSLNTLRFASVIARHGSRSPLFTYPTDPYPFYDEKYWPDGRGYMTRYGKQQEFAVGQRLRSRYASFLSANYSPNETKIVSNLSSRDFESASCIAAGLYPPVGYQLWNPSLLWNPIPIQYEPFDFYTLVNPEICPRFLAETGERLANLNAQSNKYRKLIDYISRFTGSKDHLITEMGQIFDTLIMDEQNGLTLPEWTKRVYPEKLKFFFVQYFNTLIVGDESTIKFTGGQPLQTVWTQMRDKARGVMVPNLRMNILAGHDSTIRAVLSALGIDKPYYIETSAYLIFELHENARGYFIEVVYFNNSATVEPIKYDIPLCTSSPCPVEEFGKIAASQQYPSWQERCKWNVSNVSPRHHNLTDELANFISIMV